MKRFVFSLERVLSFTRQRERLAELREQAANADQLRAALRVGEFETQLARLADDMAATTDHAGGDGSWPARFEKSDRISHALQESQAVLEQATRKHEESRKERIRLTATVEALKVLRKKQWDEHRKEAQRSDQVHLDDMGMRRWSPPDSMHVD